MSFPRYERYKDSGVAWLGEVPDHWQTHAGRRIFSQKRESAQPTDAQLSATQKYGVIPQSLFMQLEDQKVVLAISGTEAFKHVEKDDFVISLRSFQGGLERSEWTGCVSTAYTVLRARKSVVPQFWAYLFKSSSYINVLSSTTDGIREGKSISYAQFGNVALPLPPLEDQLWIVKLLDAEISRIDALIEEQRRLIELLKEKRQAVISHAVTKGLNPNAPMKASGHEELGSIPEHWGIKALKHFSLLQRGHDLTSEQQEDGPYPVVTSGGIAGSHSQFIAAAPGVVTGRYGSTGRFFYIEQDYWPHNTSLYVKDFHGNSPKFVWYSLQSMDFQAHSAKSAVPGIDRNDLHVLPVVVPPMEEQLVIVSYLDWQMAELERLTSTATHAIELLQERRSALISAAVTGKIDVRASVKKPVASVKPCSSGFAHQLLAAEILSRHNGPRMGRIKLQKLVHLCEYHAQIDELRGDYSRKAAGPFDASAMVGLARGLSKLHWFQEVREENRYVYRSLEQCGAHKKYLARWETQMQKVDVVLSLLGDAKTRQCEIVSTLYAAWNDLLIDGRQPTDDEILHEASSAERWHKKKEEIPRDKWEKALEWMKEKGLIPTGYGSHTRQSVHAGRKSRKRLNEPA